MNSRFSREFLFELNVIKNHAIGINFNPTSNAFKEYGKTVVITKLLLTEKEFEELTKNLASKLDTEGYIKASGFISKELEKIDLEVIFQTNEIFEIEYYNPTP